MSLRNATRDVPCRLINWQSTFWIVCINVHEILHLGKCSVPWVYGQDWKRDLLQAHLTLGWSVYGQLYPQLCETYLLCEYTAFPGMPKSKFVKEKKKKKKILCERLWRSTKKVVFDVIGYNIFITLKCVCTFIFYSIWSVLKATSWATNLTLFKQVQPNP